MGGTFFKKVPFFHKNVHFLTDIECYPKFLEYVLLNLSIKLFQFSSKLIFEIFE